MLSDSTATTAGHVPDTKISKSGKKECPGRQDWIVRGIEKRDIVLREGERRLKGKLKRY